VIAVDQDHARGIAKIMSDRLGVRPVLATSDDPRASEKIGEFAEGDAAWIVAVRMVSEGVDIPRLRVGVYATNTCTDLFFRQAVGRLVRWSGSLLKQTAYMFIPDDPRLRGYAHGIAEHRRHSLRKPDSIGDEPDREESEETAEGDEQLSLFSAISAVPLDEEGNPLDLSRVHDLDAADEEREEEAPSREETLVEDHFALATPREDGEPFALTPPEHEPLDDPLPAPPPVHPKSLRGRKKRVRELNSAIVRALVRTTGRGHSEVNAELNRRAGLRRVTEATLKQLERRLEVGEAWLRSP
jgi:hypothetical protein